MRVEDWGRDLVFLTLGLWKGFMDLGRWASDLPSADILSWALLLIVGYLILSERIGADRCRLWGWVLLYTACIYLTLPLLPTIWKTLYIHTNGRINQLGQVSAACMGLVLILNLVLKNREGRWWVYGSLVAVCLAYAAALARLRASPAERLHLAEYGFLSFLTFRALRVDLAHRSAYFWGWIVASGLGALDEGIQALLPNRVGEWADVQLNVLSSGLGMVVVVLTTLRP